MLESSIQALIQSTLLAGVAARLPTLEVIVKQNNQPRQVAVPSTPTIFFSYQSSKAWGWQQKKDTYNQTASTFNTKKSQVIHSRYTVAALAPRSSANPYALTSADLLRVAKDVLQDEDSIVQYVAQGCNIFRIQDLPSVWFQDSSDQNALWSSFDIIFTHLDSLTTSVGVITDFNGSINRV